ncbi:Hyaluronan / mRNA binding family [Carpediemonas membranifera]|uniref:Hyaluronan / mRNA binding family n=1 Tax=Carpediemonas membranifera TaxID=201153 RepID=A0A8J6C1B4_9EUKA|nr:Hyaluronan / mRNA binding family [Carpediemonas membranifera]|eukprot:KAG9397401.1 Hyaluronan / mRNA binding family [Carpediemonas membranifera]
MAINKFALLEDEVQETTPVVEKKVTATKKVEKVPGLVAAPASRADTHVKKTREEKPLKHNGLGRHSGTGRGKEVRKGGKGAHAWGDEKPEYKGSEAARETTDVTEAVEGETTPAEPEVELISADAFLKNRVVVGAEAEAREVDDSAYEGKGKKLEKEVDESLTRFMNVTRKKNLRTREAKDTKLAAPTEISFRTASSRPQRDDRERPARRPREEGDRRAARPDRKPRTERTVPGNNKPAAGKGVKLTDADFPALH